MEPQIEELKDKDPVILVTAIGYIVGRVNASKSASPASIYLDEVCINCVASGRLDRFSEGLAVQTDQVIGYKKLVEGRIKQLIGEWEASIDPTAV